MADTLKIMMLESGGWGGIHSYTHALANGLAGVQQDLQLITNEKYELEDRPSHFQMIRILRRESYLKTLWRLLRIFRKYKPDILHIQSLISQRKDLLLFAMCRLMGVRIVLTVHNILPHEVRPFERWIYAGYYRRADALVIHSEINKETLLAAWPKLPSDKVHHIPHGNYDEFRDYELPQDRARHKLTLPTDKKLVLFFGAIRPYKGLDLFLKLVKPLRAQIDNIHFVVAGNVLRGSRAEYDEQVEALGLTEDDITLRYGYLSMEDAIAYVCAADLIVLPYREIYQSGVLLFAYSFSRPVLATAVGSFPETIEHGKSGWLVEKGDQAALEAELVQILSEPTQLAQAGSYARELADKIYNWSDIALKTKVVYAGLRSEV